ncbi:MAG: hypothetical protein EHM41_00060 [Chloroflexi bacterium]|nr:MAG: hypothetical protein EHM41_00060 [Chloroflexota bacterium]
MKKLLIAISILCAVLFANPGYALTLSDGKPIEAAAIDDTKGNGDVNNTWSADKIYDEIAAKVGAASPALTGDPTITDATPTLSLQDSDNAAGTAALNANSSGGANDVILSVGVEDSTGASTPYVEIDGVSETVDLLKPVVLTGDITVGGGDILTGNIALRIGDSTTDSITLNGESETLLFTPTADVWTLSSTTGAATVVGLASYSLGAAGVKLTGDGDGAITFLGLGDGSDEALTLNLDDTSNTAVVSSTTGVDRLTLTGMNLTVGALTTAGALFTDTSGNITSSNTLTLSGITDVPINNSGSTLELPNAADPTTDTAGEVAVDSSAAPGSGIRFYGDAAYTLAGTYSKSFVITTPVAGSDYPIWCSPYAITIKHVRVQCLGGTNIIGQLSECDAEGINCAVVDSADITATANNSVDDDGTLSNSSIDALDYVGWLTTSIDGTPTSVTITFDYIINQVN